MANTATNVRKTASTTRNASRSAGARRAPASGNMLRLVKGIRGVSATEGFPLEFKLDGDSYWMVIPKNFTQAHYEKITGILQQLVSSGSVSQSKAA